MADDIPRPPLTEAYRKAHKSYVLASGLLAAWELIGVTLDTKGRWGVDLKSPSAVPLILFTLVFYSGYKMTIEWLQCEPISRTHRAARLDHLVAHLIALTALSIALLQYLWRIQIVELANHWFSKDKSDVIFVACFGALGVILAKAGQSFPIRFRHFQSARYEAPQGALAFLAIPLFFTSSLCLGLLVISFLLGRQIWARGILHFAVSSAVGLSAFVFFRVIERKRLKARGRVTPSR